MVLGVPSPAGLLTPVDDPAIPFEDKAEKFADWVSTFWNPLQTPESITTEALVNRYDMYKATGDERYMPDNLRLPKEEVEAMTALKSFPV